MGYAVIFFFLFQTLTLASSPSWREVEHLYSQAQQRTIYCVTNQLAPYYHDLITEQGWQIVSYNIRQQLKPRYFGNHSIMVITSNTDCKCFKHRTLSQDQGYLHTMEELIIRRLSLVAGNHHKDDQYETVEDSN